MVAVTSDTQHPGIRVIDTTVVRDVTRVRRERVSHAIALRQRRRRTHDAIQSNKTVGRPASTDFVYVFTCRALPAGRLPVVGVTLNVRRARLRNVDAPREDTAAAFRTVRDFGYVPRVVTRPDSFFRCACLSWPSRTANRVGVIVVTDVRNRIIGPAARRLFSVRNDNNTGETPPNRLW